jgi:hypothetical protein
MPEKRGMTMRTLTGWPDALRAIAVGLFWTQLASGQSALPDAGEPGDCTPSSGPHDECPERCPSFDTCYIEDELQLYYRVEGERFECDGLDCTAASTQLADYCCQRGEYAPSHGGGGGGCALASPPSIEPPGVGARSSAPGLCLGALGLLVVSRRARARRS